MDIIDNMSGALIWLVRTGCVLRFSLISIAIMIDDEKEGQYKRRRKNTIIFFILAESIFQIQNLIARYL